MTKSVNDVGKINPWPLEPPLWFHELYLTRLFISVTKSGSLRITFPAFKLFPVDMR